MLEVGMYVRCPFDTEAEKINESRTFFLGQVQKVDEENDIITVVFHDHLNLRSYFKSIPTKHTYNPKHLSRVTALTNSVAIFKGFKVKILSISVQANKENQYTNYFVEYQKNGKPQVAEVCETQIEIPFTRANYNPVLQLLKYELQNPKWYLRRKIVSESLNIIDNSPSGFKNLLGTRVHLFTHQVDTIIRALSDNPCRLMLADEVGLGKTIEALAIAKGLLDKRPNLKVLIVVPETLIYQWQTELSFKFWIDAPIWGVDKISNDNILLVSTDMLLKSRYDIICNAHFDLCIVDETHKLLKNDRLFDTVLQICKTIENVLLLSATPILHREEEYHKLLTLLNPTRFEHMPTEKFNTLLAKQKNIRDIVFNLMRDLPDYIEYDLYPDFIDGLEEINEEINDEKLASLIKQADENSTDKGLSVVKLALSYISEFYQIERGIIRHRRAEISNADIKRDCTEISYRMSGSDVGVYEENCYNAVLDYIESLGRDDVSITISKTLLNAVTSSPYAVIDCIQRYSLSDVNTVLEYAKQWKKSVDIEVNRISEVADDIDNFYSKFSKIVDYIDQEDVSCNKKYLVFTGFTATAKVLERCFKNFFGEDSTCAFHADMSGEEMQESASMFQNEESYRFMICDESGGEGRNFQVADYIIHCDLPWSPALLEQRIGRLDRIGRDINKKVTSIVCYSEESIENDLFNIYNRGLNIFNKSLCGMEIAFEEIHNSIENALKDDARFGLSNVVDKIQNFAEQMDEEVEKERYFDLARQLDLDLQDKLHKLIGHFTDNDGAELMNTMLAWPSMAGFRGISITDAFKDGGKVVSIDTTDISERSMQNTLYFPPRMDEIIRRSKYKNNIRGTFSRTTAVKHENIAFFAPFNPFFDSITKNAEECYKGRCVAFNYKQCQFDYIGLLFTWNIKYNPNMIYRNNISPETISLINRYLSNEQVKYTRSYLKKYEEVTVEQIEDQLKILAAKKPIHLGKRDNGAIDNFKRTLPWEQWKPYVQSSYAFSKKYAIEQAAYLMEPDKARQELEQLLTVGKARELFYGELAERSLLTNKEEIDALVYGLKNPIIELDSVAFIWLEQ